MTTITLAEVFQCETYLPVTVSFEPGFPPQDLAAVANKRYVNKYYFDFAKETWFIVLETKLEGSVSTWLMREVEEEFGQPFGNAVKTSSDLWAPRFADRPFSVISYLRGNLPSVKEWFASLLSKNVPSSEIDNFYESYVSRLSYSSSFEALVRLGIVSNS